MAAPATTPKPPYYAVIFTSVRHDGDNGYGEAAKQMLELASKQPGFLGFETVGARLKMTTCAGLKLTRCYSSVAYYTAVDKSTRL